jgi:Protein of unknown function (DUF1367)
MEIAFRKVMGGWSPETEEDAEKTARYKIGAVIHADWKEQRNVKFHRKYFAMLKFAFDHWDVDEYEGPHGKVVQKNFDRFRADVQIMAGYYDLVINLRGEARADAKSISFGRMDQPSFDKLYSDVANVILQKVLKSYTRDDLDRVVEQVLGFT